VVILGVLVSLSPLPVLAEVLSMTESGRARAAVALAAGYASALAVIAGAAVVLGSRLEPTRSTGRATALVDLVGGVLLEATGVRMVVRRRRGQGRPLPGWVRRVGGMGVVAAFCLGAFLPPYVVAVAAGNEIVRQGSGGAVAWAEAIVFVLVACIGVTTPIVVVLTSPAGPEVRLAAWRAWLEHHWGTVASCLVLAAGAYLAVKGIRELSQLSRAG